MQEEPEGEDHHRAADDAPDDLRARLALVEAPLEEYGRYFPTNKPARTTVEVMLNSPDLLVEITVTACIPD